MVKINLPKKLNCKRCKHSWVPRKGEVTVCPKCKSPYWNTKRVLAIAAILLLLTTVSTASDIDQAKREIDSMGIEGVSVSTITPGTFTEDQEERIREVIEQLKTGGENESNDNHSRKN